MTDAGINTIALPSTRKRIYRSAWVRSAFGRPEPPIYFDLRNEANS